MEFYNDDCLQAMKLIPDKSVDLIICDLPYEVLHKNNKHVQWVRMIPIEPLWYEYLRIAKENAAIVLFCQGMFTAKLMMSADPISRAVHLAAEISTSVTGEGKYMIDTPNSPRKMFRT